MQYELTHKIGERHPQLPASQSKSDTLCRPLEEIKILKSRVVEPEDDEENGTEVAETS